MVAASIFIAKAVSTLIENFVKKTQKKRSLKLVIVENILLVKHHIMHIKELVLMKTNMMQQMIRNFCQKKIINVKKMTVLFLSIYDWTS